MNKYQEALDYVNKSVCTALSCLGVNDTKTKESLHTLQELVDKEKSPTLEEVKKEWEELGYEFELYSNKIELINSRKNNEIIIWFNPNYYDCGNSISLKEHQLLTKTFKALGWL